MFGGIAFSSMMGWWATESTKQPATFTEGEFAGQADPADIRGSYTFGDIEKSFDVTPEVLAQAFGITQDEPAVFAVKELEALYPDVGVEIGAASLRLFVAYYAGLPFDTTAQEVYLPEPAVDILLAKGNLQPDQIAYLEAHTVLVGESAPAAEPALEPASVPASSNEVHTVKGKTTFGELITWGAPQKEIERLIDAPLPDPAMTLKDYASLNGLDFETLKTGLQAEVDKANQ
jgi:hypothetical protein